MKAKDLIPILQANPEAIIVISEPKTGNMFEVQFNLIKEGSVITTEESYTEAISENDKGKMQANTDLLFVAW